MIGCLRFFVLLSAFPCFSFRNISLSGYLVARRDAGHVCSVCWYGVQHLGAGRCRRSVAGVALLDHVPVRCAVVHAMCFVLRRLFCYWMQAVSGLNLVAECK